MNRWALGGALLVFASGSARAQPALLGSAEVTAGGGHDSNMLLRVTPAGGTRQPLVGDWFARVAPRLAATLTGGGWRFDASYALDLRLSRAGGRFTAHDLQLSLGSPRLGRLQLTASAQGGLFVPSSFSEDRFFYGAGELAFRLEVDAAFHVSGSYRAELRRYPDRAGGAESDLVHEADLRVVHRPDRWASGAGVYVTIDLARASLTDTGELQVVRVGPSAEVVLHRVSLGGWAWGGSLAVSGLGRTWQMGAGLGCLVRVIDNVDALASVDWTASPWDDGAAASDYSRRYFAVSVIAHATRRVTPRSQDHPEREGAGLAPLVLRGRVRFRVKAERAAAAEVIGSWDGWRTPGRPLAASGAPGVWQAWVALPPGTHRYRFRVDGQVVRPPDAPRYLTDDFGGEDAVIDLPP